MTRTRRIAVLTTAMLSVVTIGACHKKPAPQPEPVAAPVGPNADSARRAQEDAARRAAEEAASRRRADSISAADAAARDAAGAVANLRTTLTTAISMAGAAMDRSCAMLWEMAERLMTACRSGTVSRAGRGTTVGFTRPF